MMFIDVDGQSFCKHISRAAGYAKRRSTETPK